MERSQETDQLTKMDNQPPQQTDDLEKFVRDALVNLVSEQSQERLSRLCKQILNEFQTDFEQSIHHSSRLANGEHDLEQVSIEELENLKCQLKTAVEEKKDKLFKQSTIGHRLSTKLTQINEVIERNERNIKEFFENGNLERSPDELLDDCVERWNVSKCKINEKFQIIDQLLKELES